MGMSSSQARLLSLTARMHDIELKSQRIQAEKLRLARQSDKVYEDYLVALDAKKLQYKAIQTDGSIVFRDATMNAMQNYLCGDTDASHEVLFMQGVEDGRMYLTPAVAAKYGLTDCDYIDMDLDTYLISQGHHKTVGEVPTHPVPSGFDYTKPTGYTPVGVSVVPGTMPTPVYTPVANVDGSGVINYKDFQIANVKEHSIDTSGLEEFTTSTMPVADEGKTYKISSAASFIAFNAYMGSDDGYYASKGNTFVLANDIDFSGVDLSNLKFTYFQGTFDGNGYIMKNINIQKTSATVHYNHYYDYDLDESGNIQYDTDGNIKYKYNHFEQIGDSFWGLFSRNAGTIKNLGIENYNANVNTTQPLVYTYYYPDHTDVYNETYAVTEFGGIAGTNQGGGLIENCWFDGKITINDVPSGDRTHTGGLCGTNANGSTIKNCSVTIDLTNNGGQCVGGVSGHNDGTLNSCWATGNVHTCIWGGGLVGHNDGVTTITDCITTVKVTGTACIGAVVGCTTYSGIDSTDMPNQSLWTKKSGYDIADPEELLEKIKSELTIDNIVYDPTLNPTLTKIGDCADIGTDTSFKILVTTPSVDPTDYTGGFYSNVYGALIKSGMSYTDVDEEKVKQYVENLYNSTDGGIKIANINNFLFAYINGSGGSSPFITALINDINSGSISGTTASAYQSTYTPTTHKSVVPTDTSDAWSPYSSGSLTKGTVTGPTVNTLKEEIMVASKIAGTPLSSSDVDNWLAKYDLTSSKDRLYLDNIAQRIFKGNNLSTLWGQIGSAARIEDETYWPYSQYDGEFRTEDDDLNISYEVNYINVPTGEPAPEWWDMSDPDIAKDVSKWVLSRHGVKVVTPEQAASGDYISNMVGNGLGVLTKFSPENVSELSTLSIDQINAMSDYDWDKLLGIENTSVAVNVSVREVENEVNLKKAEAKYEADMRVIDRKDAKYDAELAACENERSAIKNEMDTLKNVIKDNVDKTFKLFS
ncbi:MAG: hypothetical protein K6E29_00420 [Cyanobacteria bacterium RUI128]|nr:hypothetical protein [Cyanobacteria bacterium RUI128]